jgi:hypothetical protein
MTPNAVSSVKHINPCKDNWRTSLAHVWRISFLRYLLVALYNPLNKAQTSMNTSIADVRQPLAHVWRTFGARHAGRVGIAPGGGYVVPELLLALFPPTASLRIRPRQERP